MDKLKNTIEDRFLESDAMQGLFPDFSEKEDKLSKYISVSVKLSESGDRYDVHECVISIKSDKVHFVNAFNVIDGMVSLEEPWGLHEDDPHPHILKIIFSGIDNKGEKGEFSVVS